ncbi:MAG: YbfB/YjiJ family MFS transporter [Chromatiales bacterium]|jgi:predicted MFS family arabinose efflux permease|nr:YbfB/YjiJ family MFS transporter [Chromatiales bacterium]
MSPAITCMCLGLSAAVAVGLGRFAYALVLPSMQSSLAWSYAEAGSLNAANSAGYLLGALIAHRVAARVGLKTAFAAGSLICAACLLLTALPSDIVWLLALRFAPGVFGAIAFVVGGVLVAKVAVTMGDRASVGVGLFYTGPGVGMLLAGVSVPPLLMMTGDWRTAWISLGVAGLVAAALATYAATRTADGGATSSQPPASGVSLTPAIVSYLLFAAGYIGYMTFIIAAIQEGGGSALESALWWLMMGVAAVVSLRVWRRALAAADGRSLAVLNGACAIGVIMPVFSAHPLLLAISFMLFAGSFMVIVALTTNMARLARPAAEWPRWIGLFTIAFGVGQIVGPIVGGIAADAARTTDAVLWVSGILLFLAALAALPQKPTNSARDNDHRLL